MIENPQEIKVDQYKDNTGKKIIHLLIGAGIGVGMLIGESFIVGIFAAVFRTPTLLYALGLLVIIGNIIAVVGLMRSSLRFIGIGLLVMLGLIVLIFGGCVLVLQSLG